MEKTSVLIELYTCGGLCFKDVNKVIRIVRKVLPESVYLNVIKTKG